MNLHRLPRIANNRYVLYTKDLFEYWWGSYCIENRLVMKMRQVLIDNNIRNVFFNDWLDIFNNFGACSDLLKRFHLTLLEIS